MEKEDHTQEIYLGSPLNSMSYSIPHLREIVHYNLDQDYNNNTPLTLSNAKIQISYHQLILEPQLNQFTQIDLI
jgi:hypothetical protein